MSGPGSDTSGHHAVPLWTLDLVWSQALWPDLIVSKSGLSLRIEDVII